MSTISWSRSAAAVLPMVLAASCARRPPEPAQPATAPSEASPIPSAAPPSPAIQRGIEAGDVNRGIDPCGDFYEYANGSWRAQNPIPAGKPRWSRRAVARETNRQQVRALIQEIAAKQDWPTGSPEQLVGDDYASCMNEAAVEAAGISPLAPLLAGIDAARTPADVQRGIRRLHDLGIAAAFGETAAYDNLAPKDFLLQLTAGGLGLPERDGYLKSEPRWAELRVAYRRHVARVLALGGMPASAALAAAEGVIALEKRLAEASLDAKTAADPTATEHRMTFAQLTELAPHIEWDKYFDEAGIPRELANVSVSASVSVSVSVNVTEPKLLQQVDKELRTAPIATWRAYLRWQLLDAASPWLSRAFADEAFAFKAVALGGGEPAPRALRCAESVEALLGESVGQTFATRYFPLAAKAKARAIANGLVAILKEDVAGLSWMAEDTRKTALQKLDMMSIQIGYPDVWKDVSKLEIRRDALWANIARARHFQIEDARHQVGKPTDRGSWQLAPSSPDAYLDPQLDELVLPAGFLQPPYFDAAATDAVNYGALGAGLAHDMTHAFDATGAQIDAAGRMHPWWTEADQAQFQKRAQCVIDQYESYSVEPGVHHQGRLVLNEALGDQSGVHFAYLAFERAMAAHPVPAVDGFTPAQQFFLAWAQFRGEAVRTEAQRQMVKDDPHAVPKFRVIGPLSNLPEFAHAFSCKAGAAMVRPPDQRCAVW